MFTLNIHGIFGAGKGEMKWVKDAPNSIAEVQNRDVYAELIKVKPENRKALLESLSLEQLKVIQDRINALKGGTHANLVWRGQVSTEINRLKEEKSKALQVLTPASPLALAPASVVASAPQLVAVQQVEDTAVVVQQAEKINEVKNNTLENIKNLKGEMKNLADLNNDKNIDTTLRDIVTERELLNALSRVTEGGKEDKLKEVYKNVTGKELVTSDIVSIAEFQTKLRTSLRMIQKLTGGNAGLYGLLTGKLDAYAVEIAKIPESNRKLGFDQSQIDDLTPSARNLLAGLASAGVIYLTGGMVVTDYKKNEINPDTILKRLDRSIPTKILDSLRDIFTARRFSITLGQDLKMDVTQFTDKVADFAKALVTNDKQNTEAQRYLTETQKIADSLKLGGNTEVIQKTAIHAYILDLANGNTGTDWTARLSLLFIGVNYDAIDKVTLATKYDKFNEAEASLNQRKLTSTEMSDAGIKIEKNVDGTFNHIIPSNVKFAYDAVGLSVSLPSNINPSKMDGVYDMNFSDKSGAYVITFKKRNPQPTVSAGANVLPAGTLTGKQEIAKVTVAREKRLTLGKGAKTSEIKEFQAKQEFANELYNEVGHQKRPEFKELLNAINTRDPDARDTAISKIAKIDKPLSLKLLADKDNYLTWTTYMYGSKESRMKDNPSQSGADAMRTPDVLRAEALLAEKADIVTLSKEADFRLPNKKDKHEAKQASELFPGQEMTLAVFATPRGGHHRIDQLDGSVAMSQKTKTLDGDHRDQVIDMLSKKSGKGGIAKQLEKLNTFLMTNHIISSDANKITIESFVKYLKSGDIKDLGNVQGLKLQAGKDTKVFEGRAMVGGNVCMNRMYGITYPAFEIQSVSGLAVKEKIDPAGSVDASATLAVEGIGGTVGAVGVSPIAITNRLNQNDTPTTPKDGKATTDPGSKVTTGPGTGGPLTGGTSTRPGVVTPVQVSSPVKTPVIMVPHQSTSAEKIAEITPAIVVAADTIINKK